MKINICSGTSRMVDRPRKSIKLLSHLKKEVGAEEYEHIQDEFNRSFGSESSIKILDGSFSKLQPIGAKRTAKSMNYNQFNPSKTSTTYEDVTDVEVSEGDDDNNDDEALNTTFNYEKDVLDENLVNNEYMKQVAGFVQKTKQMVATKTIKRAELLKKLRKYQKKVKSVEDALKEVDKIISFATQVPTLIDNLRQE